MISCEMLKSFDRYVLKEVASPFALGLLVYTVTLLLNMMIILSERLISKDVSAATIFKYLLYMVPDLLSFTIPMAILMGVLAGLSRMSTDSEVVAFKTLGIDNWRLLRPILLFSVAGWLVASWLIMFVAPEAGYRLSQLNTQILLSKSVADVKPRVVNRDFHPYAIYFNDVDHKTGEWKNVFLYSRKRSDVDTVVLAKRGKFVQNPDNGERHIALKDSKVCIFNWRQPKKRYEQASYSRLREKLPKDHEIRRSRTHSQYSLPELYKKMKKEGKKKPLLAIEFHRKFALPFACVAMGFLALSLGISTKKGGKVSGFILSLGIIFVYYSIITAFQNLALKGIVPPFLGMWAADIFLLIAGGIAYYYSSKEKSINLEKLFSLVDKVKERFYQKQRQLSEKHHKVILVLKFKRTNFRILNILDLYVMRRLLVTFVFIFLSIILVFYMVTIMELVDNVIKNEVSFFYVLKYVYYYTPEMIKFVLPVSVLTSVLLTFSVMSKNNEIVAVQVSGISLYRLALPAIILGLLLSLGFFYVQENVLPGANRNANKTMDIIRKRTTTEEQEFHKNWVVGNHNEFYFYDHLHVRKKQYIRFNMLYMDDNFAIKRRVAANAAYWETDNQLVLLDGFERVFEAGRPKDSGTFAEKRITVEGGKELFTKKVKDYRYMNIEEMKDYITYLEENRSDTSRYEAQLHNKYAFPFASLVMVLIAIPFSFLMGKRGTLYGIGVAIGISIVFWGAFGIFSALGATAVLPPFVSAFGPLLIFSGLSTYLFINVKT